MTTKGNLELRVGTETLFACANADGYRAYGIVSRLLDFLDATKNPSATKFGYWFTKTSKELFGDSYKEGRIGGIPCEVVIDIQRKLILHTPTDEDELGLVGVEFPTKFENACILLKTKYSYSILEYENPSMRDRQERLGTE